MPASLRSLWVLTEYILASIVGWPMTPMKKIIEKAMMSWKGMAPAPSTNWGPKSGLFMMTEKSPPVMVKKAKITPITAMSMTSPWKASVRMEPDMPETSM